MIAFAVGSLLVLGSWIVLAALGVALGSGFAAASRGNFDRSSFVRHSLWWGLSFLTGVVLLVNLVVPLDHWGALVVVLGIAALSLSVAALLVHRRSVSFTPTSWMVTPGALAAIGVLAASQVYLAVAALGPVTNYDTGLYHLGAIAYARELPALTGLANVYAPLGYGTAEFPLAAFMGSGPWQSDGFRLLNGFLMGALALDAAIRVIQRRWTAGTYVMLVGVVAAWVPLLALADYWVTSPSQDTAAFVLISVSVSYLVDAVTHPDEWLSRMSVSLIVAVTAVLIRPTMAFFLVGLVIVAVILVTRRRTTGLGRATTLVGLMAGISLVAMLIRDVLLSGWLLFPLSQFPMPVPWRAADPAELRIATLGYHRDPSDLWGATQGWGWADAWVGRLPQMWEAYEFLLLIIAALVALALVTVRQTLRWRSLVLAMTPSGLAVIAWWTVTPPSFRFAWGPIFTLAAIPLGWSLWRLSRTSNTRSLVKTITVAGVVAPLFAVLAFSAAYRLDTTAITQERNWILGVNVPYVVAPLPAIEVDDVLMISGIKLRVPVTGEQCWGNFPLCTPTPNPGLAFRGTSIRDGFTVY